MTPLTTSPPATTPVDDDLAEQARPGHGIPSQDPNPGAQYAMTPQDKEREVNSVLAGGGAIAGVAAGAAIGVMVAGPVGVLVGSTLGAVAGAMGGAAAGTLANPPDSGEPALAPNDLERQRSDESRSAVQPDLPFVDPGR